MEQVIKAKWWRVPASEVPRDRDEVVAWLFDQWERIDAWIAENRPVRPGASEALPPASSTVPPSSSTEPTRTQPAS